MKNLGPVCAPWSALQWLVVTLSAARAAVGYRLSEVVSGRVETDHGILLHSFPEIEAFVYFDLPFFDRVEIKIIPQALPELVLVGAAGRELERLPLHNLHRQFARLLLLDKGFQRKLHLQGQTTRTGESTADTGDAGGTAPAHRRMLRGLHFIKNVMGDGDHVFGEMDLV